VITIDGYVGRRDFIADMCRGRNVLHLGAVGQTLATTEQRVALARDSLHAELTKSARKCVGVDHSQEEVRLLSEQGVFTNLIAADVLTLRRSSIPLESIDVIVAGDIIEHLSDPGGFLETLRALSHPKTRLILSTPNSLGAALSIRYMLGRAIESDDHVCGFNVVTLVNLLSRHGWQAEEVKTCYQEYARKHGTVAFAAGHRLFSLVPRMGGTLVVVCTTS
jgi:2-polyprenyl-3-methyl-5-hydroxy-6-metoxy-1,4-benzoquinol methylase